MTDRCLSCGRPYTNYGPQGQAHITIASVPFASSRATDICWECMEIGHIWAAQQAREAEGATYHGPDCTCECCRPEPKESEEKQP